MQKCVSINRLKTTSRAITKSLGGGVFQFQGRCFVRVLTPGHIDGDNVKTGKMNPWMI